MLLLLMACSGGASDDDTTDSTDDTTQVDDTAVEGCPAPVPLATEPVDACPELSEGLLEVDGSKGSFLLSVPQDPSQRLPVIVFLPGGPADIGSASNNYFQWLAKMPGVQDYWVLVPHTSGAGSDRAQVALDTLAHFQGCFEHDSTQVHLIGHSSGGRVAYPLAVDTPVPFRSLTGLPGTFGDETDQELLEALECVPVHHVAGSEDAGWVDAAREAQTRMEGLGLNSTLNVVEGMGHGPNESWDGSLVSDFFDALD